MKKELLVALMCSLFALTAMSQTDGNFEDRHLSTEISASEFYMLNHGGSSYEFSVAHQFKDFSCKLNVGQMDLGLDHKIWGESLAWFIPELQSEPFSMIPELGVGVAHGKFENDETTARLQVHFSVCLRYEKNGLWTGINLKWLQIKDLDAQWMLGVSLGYSF